MTTVHIDNDGVDRRESQSFREFLAMHRLASIAEAHGSPIASYRVGSLSGKAYVVRLRAGSSWVCSCPSHKTCRHIRAVVGMRRAEADSQ